MLQLHIFEGQIECRWASGFEHAQRARAFGQQKTATADFDPPSIWLDARRSRIIPNRLLAGPRPLSELRAPLSPVLPTVPRPFHGGRHLVRQSGLPSR
jgi:hypothetical protein